MKTSCNTQVNLNKILGNIKFKKQYIKKLKKKVFFLDNIKEKNYKNLSSNISNKKSLNINEHVLINYIIDITFSQSNTTLHVMDSSGNLKFFYSAGSVKYKGKSKKSRFTVFRDLYRILVSKLKFLKSQPIAVHLKNTGSANFWILKRLKKKFFIKIVKTFNTYPYNGCRKRKMKRKKIKKRRNGRVV